MICDWPGCQRSWGFDGAGISGMKGSLPKWVPGIPRRYFESLMSYDVKEFEP